MPSAVVLRHDPLIGLGNLEHTLLEHGYEITVVDTPTADLEAVDPASADLLVVLGGEEGAYEGETYPYIDAEIGLLRERVAARAPVFGVCLGAQLLAASLGAAVFTGPRKELGYLEVKPTDAGADSPVRHLAEVPVLQWHGDTFDLPDGATRLASSPAYENQAFAIEHWLLAVQFHPEVTAAMHDEWVALWSDELPEYGRSVQSMAADRDRYSDAMQRASRALLGDYLRGLQEQPSVPSS